MTSFGKYLGLIFMALSTSIVSAGELPDEPTWPLDLSTRYLTSNFMEFRSGRFHAGLDLKTQSREGFTVRAVEDGYISRVRCTPTAYGRVVYLRGISGRTFVFAHLSRFNDDLQTRVEQAQQRNGSYRARLEFKPDQIPITKGQVLGISGQSGTNGPHLHFEVRDRNQRPINPLDQGFLVEDLLPPVIHRLRAWPVTSSSKINGSEGEWILDADDDIGLLGDLGVLNISGPVAFSASMIDASDIRGHKLEPWLIELTLDDEVVYRCENQRYAFTENSLQRLEWTDWADWTDEGVPREHWLHRREANTLTGREGDLWYLGSEGEGLSPGDHSLVLRVLDHSGAEASARLLLRVQAESASAEVTSWRQQSLGIMAPQFPGTRLTPFYSSGDPVTAGFEVLKLSPENQDDVLEPLEIWVRTMEASDFQMESGRVQGLRLMGSVVFYATADWPIESSVPIALPSETTIRSTISASSESGEEVHVGVYRFKGKKRWEFVTTLGHSQESKFLLEKPGLHAIFLDEAPPVFQNQSQSIEVKPGPVSDVEGVTFPKWEITPINLDDLGSGIDTGSLSATLDGASLIIEPDGPRDRLLIQWPDHMTVGKHQLQIEVSDQAGNKSTASYQIQVQEDKP